MSGINIETVSFEISWFLICIFIHWVGWYICVLVGIFLDVYCVSFFFCFVFCFVFVLLFVLICLCTFLCCCCCCCCCFYVCISIVYEYQSYPSISVRYKWLHDVKNLILGAENLVGVMACIAVRRISYVKMFMKNIHE